MRNILRSSILLLLVVCVQGVVKAQDAASVTGVVTDPSGAVIPDVHVKLDNASMNVSFDAVTNSQGSYTIAGVAAGPGYRLSFSRDGFKPVVINGLYLNVDTTRSQNVKMAVGTTAETVEVSASTESMTLDTTDATVGNNFEVQILKELPVQNRDSPTALFFQQPGVNNFGAVTGARTDQSNVTLDGLEMNDNATGQFGVIIGNAPVDSVQEFRGVTAEPLSSAGQGGGGQFVLVTTSGTNQFHGDVVEYHRDTATEANSWFNDNVFPAIPTPPLVRNQFGGGIGGPIKRDKAYFYFDYNGRRDAISSVQERTVPLDSYRNGTMRYITNTGAIGSLPSNKQFDPKGIGFDPALFSLFNSRLPHANDLSGAAGDLVNTAGYRFNAPEPFKEDDYAQRVDFNINEKMKLYGVGHVTRRSDQYGAIQFPGDPVTFPRLDRSYSYVGGFTWTISANKLNQVAVGETFEDLEFPVAFNPQGANVYGFAGLTAPYAGGNNSQARTFPIPVARDDFSWEKGRHSLTFGGTFKWETPTSFQAENFYFPSVGVTGNTNFTALSPALRPADIGSSNEATSIYDSLYSTGLGALASVGANFNYNNKQQLLQQGSGLNSTYKFYETEVYGGDTWKVTPDLTITYGMRYQNYTVPYETHGEESVSNLGSFDSYFDARVKQSAAGIEGNDAVPLLSWSLGGKANGKPSFYEPYNKMFAPRFAFAWNPSWDKKTVISGGSGIIYDHSVIDALIFQELQTSYLFESAATNLFGTAGNPTKTLQTAPRFGGITSQPPAPTAPDVTPPFTPFVSGGVPYGLPTGQFNLNVDPQLKVPYNLQFNLGMQHEFPQGFLMKLTYVGRLGRRLLAEADASQLIDFPDNTGKSSQTMAQGFGAMTTQLRAGAAAGLSPVGAILALKPQPWFEDVVAPGVGQANGFANNTQLVAYDVYPYPQRGDFADTMFVLSAFGILPPNVGMAQQFASSTIWTNKGSSNYNGLLVTLHKNAGYGLTFDINYAWSHSIDNVSVIANSIAANAGNGFICDVLRPRNCRGNSDFDVANVLNGYFIYELPVGRGKMVAANAPRWLDEAIGGWEVSGLPNWTTGTAYQVYSNAFVAGFATDAPATLIGTQGYLKTKINGGKGAPLFAFANPTQALAQFTGPTGFSIGQRNSERGPGFVDLDLSVGKYFPIYGERWKLKFQVDAFNSLNHPNFAAPSANDITESSGTPFGTITGTVRSPGSDQSARVLQGALRIEF